MPVLGTSPDIRSCAAHPRRRPFASVVSAGASALLVACLLSGCGEQATTKTLPSESDPPAASAGNEAPVSAEASHPGDWEAWDALYIQDNKVGDTHTKLTHATREGRPVVQVESASRLTVQRFNQSISLSMDFLERDSLDGRLLEVEGRFAFGGEPVFVRALADGQRLVLRTGPEGRARETTLPWAPDGGGLVAVEQSLRARSMTPGEKRSVRGLVPSLNQLLPATFDLAAGQIESTPLPGGARSLLRIDLSTRFPDGTVLPSVLWVDPRGEVLKTREESLGPESYRVGREEAEGEAAPGRIDLGLDTMVKTAWPASDPHASKRARYRVRLANDDPAKVIVSGGSQTVRSIDPHTAEVTVVAVRPGTAPKAPAGDQPTAADTAPSDLIESDDPRVVELARQAIGDRQAPWDRAVALEQFVRQTVKRKDYSQAFATAADVARTRQGDCTEHAVLLAAMARAVGIPARLAVGLVYVESAGGLGFHMWTEVFVEGAWIPLDALFGRDGIGAAHLKLAHGSFTGADVYRCLLPVARVLMQVKIDVIEVQ